MIKYCKATGVGIISWSPLYRGLLARPLDAPPTERGEALKSHPVFKYMEGADEKIIGRVAEVAAQRECQKGSVPITGMATLDRVDDAAAIRGMVLTESEIKFLEEPYQPKAVSGHF